MSTYLLEELKNVRYVKVLEKINCYSENRLQRPPDDLLTISVEAWQAGWWVTSETIERNAKKRREETSRAERSRRTRKEWEKSSHLPLAGSTLARWAQTGKYSRLSVRSAIGSTRSGVVEAIGRARAESPSAFNSEDRESRATRDARRIPDRVRNRSGEGRPWNMSGISHRWIRITGERSRFVMTFVFGSSILIFVSVAVQIKVYETRRASLATCKGKREKGVEGREKKERKKEKERE